jgi:hypothetical protein
MKRRISLRGLLLLTVCLATFCYWRDRPRQIANRFVAAIEAGDYELAESIFADDGLGLTDEQSIFTGWEARNLGQSAGEWLRGHHEIYIRAIYGRGLDINLTANASATQITIPHRWMLDYYPQIYQAKGDDY